MKISFPALVVWFGLAAHVAALVIVRRRSADAPVVAILNLAVALCVLAYIRNECVPGRTFEMCVVSAHSKMLSRRPRCALRTGAIAA